MFTAPLMFSWKDLTIYYHWQDFQLTLETNWRCVWDTDKQAGIQDASVMLYPTDGYGNPDLVRQLIQIEKPHAIFIITDPRYWTSLFQMENEIRKHMPIVYLNIWDDYPAPLYNKEFYESCDALFGI